MSDIKTSEETDAEGIGGSDTGPLFGLTPKRSALDVYLTKLGLVERTIDEEDKPWLAWGRRLEPVIAGYYEEVTGRELVGDGTEKHRDKEHAFMTGRPDRLCKSGDRGLEIKTAGIFPYFSDRSAWGAEGTDEIPPGYLSQCGWYMRVMDIPVWDCAVLIGGSDFRIYELRRSPALETEMIEGGQEFWFENVKKHEPPGSSVRDSIKSMLRALYPTDNGLVRKVTIEERLLIEEWEYVREEKKRWEAREEDLKNVVRACMQDISKIEDFDEDGTIRFAATYKQTKDSTKTNHEEIAADFERMLIALGVEPDALRRVRTRHTRQIAGIRRLVPKWTSPLILPPIEPRRLEATTEEASHVE